jgi:hypothetical protein
LSYFFRKKEDKTRYYETKEKLMKEYEAQKLEVDFKHLLSEKKYLNLAVRISKDKNDRYLRTYQSYEYCMSILKTTMVELALAYFGLQGFGL